MMHTCNESDIDFTFPLEWEVIRYEQSPIHLKNMMPLQHTEAVDFVCHNGIKIMFLEAKHFRTKAFATEVHTQHGKTVNPIEHFVNEISGKFRDTLCGIAVARMIDEQQLRKFSDTLFQSSPAQEFPLCVLFLEIAKSSGSVPPVRIRQLVFEQLKKRFAPFKMQVYVLDSTSDQSNRPWKAKVV